MIGPPHSFSFPAVVLPPRLISPSTTSIPQSHPGLATILLQFMPWKKTLFLTVRFLVSSLGVSIPAFPQRVQADVTLIVPLVPSNCIVASCPNEVPKGDRKILLIVIAVLLISLGILSCAKVAPAKRREAHSVVPKTRAERLVLKLKNDVNDFMCVVIIKIKIPEGIQEGEFPLS